MFYEVDAEGVDAALGTVLADRYRLEERLGEGGMGVVYRATHRTLNTTVAIKVLVDTRAVPQATERFFREARATASIGHQNIIEVIDSGQTDEGVVYLVMEFLDGEDLAATLERRGRLPWPQAATIVVQLCRALGAAHDKGIVHCDVKTENIVRVNRDGNPDFVKVLDFGIAKLVRPRPADRRLTRTGSVFGTPAYMSPEQARGREIDHRADIYSAGVILYELITGRVPFDGEEFLDIAMQHLHRPIEGPSRVLPTGSIPLELDAIVERAMAKDRDARYGSMADFERALQQVLERVTGDEPEPGTPLPRAITGSEVGSGVAVTEAAPLSAPAHGGNTVDASAPSEPPPRRSGLWFGVGTVVGLGLLAAVAARGLAPSADDDGDDDAAAAVRASAEPSTPEPAVEAATASVGPAPNAAAPSPRTEAAPPDAVEPTVETDVDAAPASPLTPRPATRTKLRPAQVDAVLRGVQSQLSLACTGNLTGLEPGTKVRLSFAIAGVDGRISAVRASVDGQPNTAATACVQSVLKGARFPTFPDKDQRIRRTITL